MAGLYDKVTALKGIGDAKSAALEKIGIKTVYDLARLVPRAYQNRGNIKKIKDAVFLTRQTDDAPPCALLLTVSSEPKTVTVKRGITLTKFKAFDETGAIEITYFNQPFVKNSIYVGGEYRFFGKIQISASRPSLTNPIFEKVTEGAPLLPIVPVYPLSKGLGQKFLLSAVREAVRVAILEMKEYLTYDILSKNCLCNCSEAIRMLHFPNCVDDIEKAKRRFAFDEIFTLSLAMSLEKNGRKKSGAESFSDTDIKPLLDALPYGLTGAQKRAVDEISEDLKKETPMCRILCGDVGSGKTAVAAAAAYIAIKNGSRCAIMAPTEILAKQHFADLSRIFSDLNIKTELLCGSLKESEKKRVQSEIEKENGARLIVGTHALLSEKVAFCNFGLVITDEQHRFGAKQRALLKEKAKNAHSLVMSATPIPRTLSLVIYGDLDISTLDEMPPGRMKVDTFHVTEKYRKRLLAFIEKQVREGHRVYVVCPSIEEAEKKEKPKKDDAEEMFDFLLFPEESPEPPLKAAVEYTSVLREQLPDIRIGFVHGKMKSTEKDEAMSAFVKGDMDVLVSTTVIEVGVNVPEATLMIVENAERFGLSQLHQLRGRVGRGHSKSYCVLVSDTKNEKSLQRLSVMCKSCDGMKIAEEDLKMRGPGDFFKSEGSIRQSGTDGSSFSAFATTEIFTSAVESAKELLKDDPCLEKSENCMIREYAEKIREGLRNTLN